MALPPSDFLVRFANVAAHFPTPLKRQEIRVLHGQKTRQAIRRADRVETIIAQRRLKRHLHTLGLQLGLLANFRGTRLHIQPVRIVMLTKPTHV